MGAQFEGSHSRACMTPKTNSRWGNEKYVNGFKNSLILIVHIQAKHGILENRTNINLYTIRRVVKTKRDNAKPTVRTLQQDTGFLRTIKISFFICEYSATVCVGVRAMQAVSCVVDATCKQC